MLIFDKNLCVTLSSIATFNSLSSFYFLFGRIYNYILVADGAVKTCNKKPQFLDFKMLLVHSSFERAEYFFTQKQQL